MRNLRGVRDTTMVDEAIESAAEYITKKEERRHKKHSCCDKRPPSILTLMKEEKKKERKISFPPDFIKKDEKKERKISACDKFSTVYAGYGRLLEDCDCETIREHLEEGKQSEALKSSITNRNVERRKGVAEQNNTERKLVKESVAVMVLTANLNEYNLI